MTWELHLGDCIEGHAGDAGQERGPRHCGPAVFGACACASRNKRGATAPWRALAFADRFLTKDAANAVARSIAR